MSEVQIPEQKEPRATSEIAKEYGNICAQIGDHSYRIKLLNTDLDTLYKKLEVLNKEAGHRAELDKAKKPEEIPTEVKTVAEESVQQA